MFCLSFCVICGQKHLENDPQISLVRRGAIGSLVFGFPVTGNHIFLCNSSWQSASAKLRCAGPESPERMNGPAGHRQNQSRESC